MSLSTDDTTTTRVHAFTDDALGTHDATGLAELIRTGEVSATEVMDAAIARSERVESRLTALERTDYDRARARARAVRADSGAPLAGVPSAFKDNVMVSGLPMTNGSQATPRTPMRKDDRIVEQIDATGAISLGTTRMPEFGWTPTTERADGSVVHNPWHTDYSAGGSSGGAAAYVAAGVLPIAHGNDGGGSLRIPAAACGIVGHKPTRGRLRFSESAARLPVRIISDGVLTRSVRDVATFYTAAQATYANSRLPKLANADRPIDRTLRVGLLLDSPLAPQTDSETRSAVEELATTLDGLGHRVEPFDLELPQNFKDDFVDYWGLLSRLVVTAGPAMFGKGFDRRKLDPTTLGLARHATRRLHRMPMAVRRLRASSAFYTQQLRGWDIVLSPVLCHTTPPLGSLDPSADFHETFAKVLDYVGFTPLHNATGAPSISLPTGQTEGGRPIGVMMSAGIGADELLIRAALQVESAVRFEKLSDSPG